jgi:hypothetical protein
MIYTGLVARLTLTLFYSSHYVQSCHEYMAQYYDFEAVIGKSEIQKSDLRCGKSLVGMALNHYFLGLLGQLNVDVQLYFVAYYYTTCFGHRAPIESKIFAVEFA